MSKKVVITGATGFIGKKIVQKLIERGDEATIFTRSIEKAKQFIPNEAEFVEWDYKLNDWRSYLEGKDAVIHLAGENVMAKRWNDAHKKNILSSRVNSTRQLVNAIGTLNNKPKVFISASAVGYYGNSEEPVTEESKPGNDFLAQVVKAWEREAAEVEQKGVRRISIRIGIVLDKNEGALARMITPFKFFIGGPLGTGWQWFPWIHIDDVVGLFLFALDNEKVYGALNAASPNPVRMNEFASTLGAVMKRPSFFKVPSLVLRLVLGEGAEVVLGGAMVKPKRVELLGYKFKYELLEHALVSFF